MCEEYKVNVNDIKRFKSESLSGLDTCNGCVEKKYQIICNAKADGRKITARDGELTEAIRFQQ